MKFPFSSDFLFFVDCKITNFDFAYVQFFIFLPKRFFFGLTASHCSVSRSETFLCVHVWGRKELRDFFFTVTAYSYSL